MSDESKPPYILLNDRLPASYTSKLLGRIVADPLWPPEEFAPRISTLVDVDDSLIEVTDEDVEITLNANSGSGVGGHLGKIIGLSRERGEGLTREMRGKRVITRSLEQQRDVFDAVVKGEARHEVLKLLSRKNAKRKGYMVVGVKSLVDAQIAVNQGLFKHVKLDTELPIAEIANEAAIGSSAAPLSPVVAPELFNPGGSVRRRLMEVGLSGIRQMASLCLP